MSSSVSHEVAFLRLDPEDLYSYVICDLARRMPNPIEYLKYYNQGITKMVYVRQAVTTYNFFGITEIPDFTDYTYADIQYDFYRYPLEYVEGFNILSEADRETWVRFMFRHSYLDELPYEFSYDSKGFYPDSVDEIATQVRREYNIELGIPRVPAGYARLTLFSLKGDPPPTKTAIVDKLPNYEGIEYFPLPKSFNPKHD